MKRQIFTNLLTLTHTNMHMNAYQWELRWEGERQEQNRHTTVTIELNKYCESWFTYILKNGIFTNTSTDRFVRRGTASLVRAFGGIFKFEKLLTLNGEYWKRIRPGVNGSVRIQKFVSDPVIHLSNWKHGFSQIFHCLSNRIADFELCHSIGRLPVVNAGYD